MRLLGVTSAHACGATALAAGLAAVLAAGARTLLVDLNLEMAQQASLLDVDDGTNVCHLAHQAQLAPVTESALEEHVRWHEGLAVLPGAVDPGQARLLREHVVRSLIDVAVKTFPWVVVDLGRVRPDLHPAATAGVPVWVVSPSPVGLTAFDRRFRQLQAGQVGWLGRVRVVVNQLGEDSLLGVPEFLAREYGVAVAGSVPYEPGFWRQVEHSHSIQALAADVHDEARYVSWFGRGALRTRRALEAIVGDLAVPAAEQDVIAAEA